LIVAAHTTFKTRVVDARARVGSSVDGLQRGVMRVRDVVASPWLHLGVAAAAGFVLGRRSCVREPAIPPVPPPEPETIAHALLRAALVTLTTSAIRRVLLGPATEDVDNGDRVRA
jgi:hypothetical protein